jgi:hypothetical protein
VDFIDTVKDQAIGIGVGVVAALVLWTFVKFGHKALDLLTPKAKQTPTTIDDDLIKAGHEALDEAGKVVESRLPFLASMFGRKPKP